MLTLRERDNATLLAALVTALHKSRRPSCGSIRVNLVAD
jgi:hypothetical protein